MRNGGIYIIGCFLKVARGFSWLVVYIVVGLVFYFWGFIVKVKRKNGYRVRYLEVFVIVV